MLIVFLLNDIMISNILLLIDGSLTIFINIDLIIVTTAVNFETFDPIPCFNELSEACHKHVHLTCHIQ